MLAAHSLRVWFNSTYLWIWLDWIGCISSEHPDWIGFGQQKCATLQCVCQAYGIFGISWHFFIPLIIFVVAYWKIFGVIRRQMKVNSRWQLGVAVSPEEQNAGTNTKTTTETRIDENQSDKGVKVGSRGNRQGGGQKASKSGLSQAQINVVTTMFFITVCFVLCWLPMYIGQGISLVWFFFGYWQLLKVRFTYVAPQDAYAALDLHQRRSQGEGHWCMPPPRRRGNIFYDQLIWICYYWLWHSNEILVSRLLTHYTRNASE